uniref:Uncharacterized protein n=1 Tax=Nelumbo nucifera TaxID=4432 RepID=A0A822ZIC4_NELNU|nr:TPA_asm: hypothetical protein HUJ06_001455 [Nelumbo nucifera]
MLERRTIVLADGSVRSYFALPPDYQDFPTPIRPLDIPDEFGFSPGTLSACLGLLLAAAAS